MMRSLLPPAIELAEMSPPSVVSAAAVFESVRAVGAVLFVQFANCVYAVGEVRLLLHWPERAEGQLRCPIVSLAKMPVPDTKS